MKGRERLRIYEVGGGESGYCLYYKCEIVSLDICSTIDAFLFFNIQNSKLIFLYFNRFSTNDLRGFPRIKFFNFFAQHYLFLAVIKICDIYDWDGKGELDLFYLGDVMYALGMNTTKKVSIVSVTLYLEFRGLLYCKYAFIPLL